MDIREGLDEKALLEWSLMEIPLEWFEESLDIHESLCKEADGYNYSI